MNDAGDAFRLDMRSWLVRVGIFFAFWVIIAGIKPADLVVGLIAALIAAAVSLQLLPPRQGRVHPATLGRLVLRFLRQSVGAGINVAWRALHPRLPLRTGFVIYNSRLPAGTTRDAFCTMTSLLPGTLPSGPAEQGGLLVHCLDVGQPMVEQLAAEEEVFAKVIGGADGGERQ